MERKYWQLLLESWAAAGNTGLSIPFVIGSQQYLPDRIERQTLEELFADIVHNRVMTVHLSYCFQIGDLILAPHPYSAENAMTDSLPFGGFAQRGLTVSRFVTELGNSVEEVIASLKDRFAYAIEQGQYSINDGERGPYTPAESAFIRSSFAALMD